MKTDKKAVSLIILIVTIIVLAILATAVIVTLTESNLINSSKNTVDTNTLLRVTDIAEAAWIKAFAEEDITTPEEYLIYIKEYLKNAGYTDKELENYNITATTDGVTVTPIPNEADEPENSLVAMYKAGTLKQGDYVDYNPEKVSPYYADGNTVGSLTGSNVTSTTENINPAARYCC